MTNTKEDIEIWRLMDEAAGVLQEMPEVKATDGIFIHVAMLKVAIEQSGVHYRSNKEWAFCLRIIGDRLRDVHQASWWPHSTVWEITEFWRLMSALRNWQAQLEKDVRLRLEPKVDGE